MRSGYGAAGHAASHAAGYAGGAGAESRNRLRHVLDADTKVPAACSSSSGAPVVARPVASIDQELESLCLRAERDGSARLWAEALPVLEKFSRQEPRDVGGLSRLARAYAALGRRDEALRLVEAALRLDPQVQLGHSLALLAAQGSADAGHWPLAARHAEAALASKPGDVVALELLIRALAAPLPPGAASPAGAAPSAEARAGAAFGVLARAAAERAAALAVRLAAGRDVPNIDRHWWLSQAVQLGNATVRPYKELGRVSLVLNREAEARKCFQKAFAQPGGARDADLAHSLAQLHERAGCTEEALETYRAALAAGPEFALHRRYGQLLLTANRPHEALEAFRGGAEAAAAAFPAEAAALRVAMADLLQALGQTADARASFREAARLDGDCVAAWNGLALACGASPENVNEQISALQHLVRLAPRVAMRRVQLGQALLAVPAPSFEGAKDAFHEALRLEPECHEAMAWLGYAHLQQGSVDQAIRLLEVEVRQPTVQPATRLHLALALASRGDDRAACLEAAAALRDFPALRRLAQLLPSIVSPSAADGGVDVAALRQAGLDAALPGATAASRQSLGALVQRSSGGQASQNAAEPRSQAASSPQDAADPEAWRDSLREGAPIEVYSKSGGRWIPASVVQLKPDVVRVKYLVDDSWCEKALLRNSDSLRLPVSSPASGTSARGGAAAPSIFERNVERARRGTEVAPTPARRQWVQGEGGGAVSSRAPAMLVAAAPVAAKSLKGVEPTNGVVLDVKELTFGPILGTGGFGAVYRGSYRGHEVAIKKLHPCDGQVSATQVEEFTKEVHNLQALRHTRLVSFIGAALSNESLCIVTEFVPNGSLYELLHKRKEAVAAAKRLAMVCGIAEGADFLHGQSPPFVHRDLKSMNVVLDFALNVKLCDFGLTQSMEKTHISRRENEGGSPRYMAPELFDSKGKITDKVDIWALGCLALEVMSGRMPHEECTNIRQVMTKTLVDKEPPFRIRSLVGIQRNSSSSSSCASSSTLPAALTPRASSKDSAASPRRQREQPRRRRGCQRRGHGRGGGAAARRSGAAVQRCGGDAARLPEPRCRA